MDIGLYWTVVRRHRRVAVVGVALSVLAAIGLLVRIGPDGIQRRGAPIWQAESTVLLTQTGFPWGRTALDEVVPVKGADPVSRFSDPERFQYLAKLYARLAASDEVHTRVRRAFGLPAVVPENEPVGKDPTYTVVSGHAPDSTALPTVTIAGEGETPERAIAVAKVAMESLRTVIRQQQNRADIGADTRVELQVVSTPKEAVVVKPNRPTKAIMGFLVGIMLTVVAAFVAEARVKGERADSTAEGTIPAPEPLSDQKPEDAGVVERLDRPRSRRTLGDAPARGEGEGAVGERARMRAPGPGA
jgi:capsular polysaccharide biosynthesis protein